MYLFYLCVVSTFSTYNKIWVRLYQWCEMSILSYLLLLSILFLDSIQSMTGNYLYTKPVLLSTTKPVSHKADNIHVT